MNQEMRKKMRIERAKRSVLGRMLCRLAGDQTGAVMMEYVILGVMIAAAAVLAVTLFGNQIVAQIRVMINAITGNTGAAQTQAGQNRTQAGNQATAAENYRSGVAGQ